MTPAGLVGDGEGGELREDKLMSSELCDEASEARKRKMDFGFDSVRSCIGTSCLGTFSKDSNILLGKSASVSANRHVLLCLFVLLFERDYTSSCLH